MDIKIIKETMPAIEINFDELKNNLMESMDKYKNIVVSEDTLSDCKAVRRDLAGLRRRIDEYRKTKKKALTNPIKAFEAQCKELMSIIDDVEQPIKEGIKVYDDARREEKRKQAEEIIQEMVKESGLRDDFASQVVVKPEHCNLTATQKDVRESVHNSIVRLQIEQKAQDEKIRAVQSIIDSVNVHNTKKLTVDSYMKYINDDIDFLSDMIAKDAALIYDAEHPTAAQDERESTKQPQVIERLIVTTITLTGPEKIIDSYIERMEADGICIEQEVTF